MWPGAHDPESAEQCRPWRRRSPARRGGQGVLPPGRTGLASPEKSPALRMADLWFGTEGVKLCQMRGFQAAQTAPWKAKVLRVGAGALLACMRKDALVADVFSSPSACTGSA